MRIRPQSVDRSVDTRTDRKPRKFFTRATVIGAGLLAGAMVSAFAAPAMATSADPYVVAVWQKPADLTKDYDQHYVTSVTLDQKSVAAGWAKIDKSKLQCGVRLQIDLYNNNSTTTSLLKGGVLHGPNNPAESFPGGQWVSAYTMYVTTDACPPPSPHKSYVCKYVGTPGVDERLQTGQNPIYVDNHSLLGHDGTVTVGQSFSDAQGRSVVIVANTPKLNPEPGIDKCPAPVTPTPTPTPTETTPTYVTPLTPALTGCGDNAEPTIGGTPIGEGLTVGGVDYSWDGGQDRGYQTDIQAIFVYAHGSFDLSAYPQGPKPIGSGWFKDGSTLVWSQQVTACESTPTPTPTETVTPTPTPTTSTTPVVTPSNTPSPKPSAHYPVASPTDGATPLWQQPAFGLLSGIILLSAAGVGFVLNKRRATTTH